MAEAGALSWSFANDARILRFFIGGTRGVLAIVAGVALAFPSEPEFVSVVDVLFGIAVFVLLFGLLVFLPRLLSRGASSYSLHVARAMDDVEEVVRRAVESAGRSVRVEVRKSRLPRPPRTVQIGGLPTRIVLRAAPYRERKGEGTSWTEIVQAGMTSALDEDARDLRERITAGLSEE